MINAYVNFANFFTDMDEMMERNDAKLEQIKQEWINSRSYPRKKKKRVRKHLLLEYEIFSFAKDMFDKNKLF